MDQGGVTSWGSAETHPEINGMVGGRNPEIKHAGPERGERGERHALLKIILVGHHAALGTAARARGINDAGGVLAATRNESRLAGAAELLPTLRSGKIGAGWRFGDEDGLQLMFAKRGRLRKEPPDMELRDQDARLRVREQLQLFLGRELVIERNENAAAIKDRIRGNQPLGLIGHDDGGAALNREAGILQRASQGERSVFELAIVEPCLLLVAVGFGEARFVGPAVDGVSTGRAEAVILC